MRLTQFMHATLQLFPSAVDTGNIYSCMLSVMQCMLWRLHKMLFWQCAINCSSLTS